MAIEMQRRLSQLSDTFAQLGLHDPLEIRIGINSGYCTVGNFGSYDRMDCTIVESPVNITARLQSVCRPGSILLSGNTHALVADQFDFVPRGRLCLKGIAEQVEAFEVEFEIEQNLSAEPSVNERLFALKEQLTQIDLEQVGDEEKERLLSAISKLLKN